MRLSVEFYFSLRYQSHFKLQRLEENHMIILLFSEKVKKEIGGREGETSDSTTIKRAACWSTVSVQLVPIA